MPLKGIRVLEMAGLAPSPFCGMVLADFGAKVIRIDKPSGTGDMDCLKNGKRSLAVDLKKPKGVEIIKKLSMKSDVLIEPYRRGVMEKLGLGPNVLTAENPRLIYLRLSGFGHTGSYSRKAGHDINFLALSGVLSFLGRKGENPLPPCALLGDFGGGGLISTVGVLLALIERSKSGMGQVIDSPIVDGTAYLFSWLFRSQKLPIWGNPRGENMLDTGSHFYETYKTKDGKYVAVGAIESRFYDELIAKLGEKGLEDQFADFEEKKKILTKIFATKTRDEWCTVFQDSDACFSPVLELSDVAEFSHNKEREVFLHTNEGIVPKPAPNLTRTPGKSSALSPSAENGADTENILLELGYTEEEINDLEHEGVIKVVCRLSKL
ncbi:UNVERIFIED_CONTAM: hypothetical protein PYX00_006568 [Menopon gallinae]|uniref:Alpha-methylacyl-CoA racemase n=1 Tax=Menopon gallinae TaxID=328185 RepID=A0AAW2HWQ3_9NEOP